MYNERYSGSAVLDFVVVGPLQRGEGFYTNPYSAIFR